MDIDERDQLTEKIIGLCFKVHHEIGAGFTEKIYHNAFIILLEEEKVKYESEKEFDVIFHLFKFYFLAVTDAVRH